MNNISEALTAAETPVEESPEQAVTRLANLPPLEYERCREAEAERLGVRVSALDKEVARHRTPDDTQGAGQSVDLNDVEPWPEPVDGAELLDNLADEARRYLVLPPGAAEAMALWIVHSHAHHTAYISPILAATSPTPACGKTTLLTFLGAVVARPLPASNVTAAALFRSVERWQPTLLVDEADTFLRDSDELRGVLNSGHQRANAFVIRTVGDDHEPRRFTTWSPKAIAMIGRLPATLSSRALHIELRRKTAQEDVQELRADRLGHLYPIQQKACRWTADHAEAIRAADPAIPPTLQGRSADNWRHLLAIADTAGGDWPARAREAASSLSAGGSDQTAGIMLLEDLRTIFVERERLSSAELSEMLGAMEDRPWPEWGRTAKPISPRQIARLLEPFGIHPTKFRAHGYTPGTRGYEREQFTEAFSRYLGVSAYQSATAPQDRHGAGFSDFHSATTGEGVADGKTPEVKHGAGCGAVADEKPVSPRGDDDNPEWEDAV